MFRGSAGNGERTHGAKAAFGRHGVGEQTPAARKRVSSAAPNNRLIGELRAVRCNCRLLLPCLTQHCRTGCVPLVPLVPLRSCGAALRLQLGLRCDGTGI